MKKAMILAAALLGAGAFSLQAADSCVIRTSDDKDIAADAVSAQPSGDLEYTSGASKIKSIVKKGKYKYAWIPKPADIAAADADFKASKFREAEEKYKKAFDANKLLGWDVYCAVKQAECLVKQDKRPEALKLLADYKDYKLVNPKVERDLMEAFKLNATILIDSGDFAAADPSLTEMLKSKDDEIAGFALLRKGDAAYKQGEKKDAVLLYLQNALLFPKNAYRAEALLKTANTLNELKDPRAARFADMLKAEYQGSPFVKQLK